MWKMINGPGGTQTGFKCRLRYTNWMYRMYLLAIHPLKSCLAYKGREEEIHMVKPERWTQSFSIWQLNRTKDELINDCSNEPAENRSAALAF